MTGYEKLMLGGVIALLTAFAVFVALMTDGLILGPRGAGFMALCVLGFLALMTVIMIIVVGPIPKSFPDEREQAIDQWSERIGYFTMEIGIFITIALALFEASDRSLGSYSLSRPEGLGFELITISTLAGLARLLTALFRARKL